MMISGERTEQLDIFFHVTGFTSDFLRFIDVELIRFFHGAIQLYLHCALAVVQCIVIGHVCGCVCLWVGLLPR